MSLLSPRLPVPHLRLDALPDVLPLHGQERQQVVHQRVLEQAALVEAAQLVERTWKGKGNTSRVNTIFA